MCINQLQNAPPTEKDYIQIVSRKKSIDICQIIISYHCGNSELDFIVARNFQSPPKSCTADLHIKVLPTKIGPS
jgi:hypothetical protein